MKFGTILVAGVSTLALILVSCKSIQSYSSEEIGLRKTTLFNEEAEIKHMIIRVKPQVNRL